MTKSKAIDQIKVLPKNIANQIAACEVIERPESALKELIENAIDAQATKIEVILKEGGKKLIQIIDNGKGMSWKDAKLCFERHATSKINDFEDLWSLSSLGFRGEALASIRGVARVELKTRTADQNIGTWVSWQAEKLLQHEFIQIPFGTNIAVKQLFFNVPARIKTLKKDVTELKKCVAIFKKLSLSHPEIHFKITNDNHCLYDFPSQNLKQRIMALYGNDFIKKLVPVKFSTSILSVSGYVGTPELSKKHWSDQFLFVNHRLVKDHYIHHAIQSSFENLISADSLPTYFLNIQMDKKMVDINVDPHKGRVSFLDEREVYQIIRSAVSSCLRKYHLGASHIDFEDNLINRTLNKENLNTYLQKQSSDSSITQKNKDFIGKQQYWKELYEIISDKPQDTSQQALYKESQGGERVESFPKEFIYLDNQYLLTKIKSGIGIIHVGYGLQRITYHNLKKQYKNKNFAIQKLLMPFTKNFDLNTWEKFYPWIEQLNKLGFEINQVGTNSIIINATPALFVEENPEKLIEDFFEYLQSDQKTALSPEDSILIGISVSKKSNIIFEHTSAMHNFIEQLFACEHSNFSPLGKKTIEYIDKEKIVQLFYSK